MSKSYRQNEPNDAARLKLFSNSASRSDNASCSNYAIPANSGFDSNLRRTASVRMIEDLSAFEVSMESSRAVEDKE